jgi:hypothetical protein
MLHQDHRDWARVIKDVGPVKFREIVGLLKAALDEYSAKNTNKAKVDAAEAMASRRTLATGGTGDGT